MKNLLFLIIVQVVLLNSSTAQIITCTPPLPIDQNSVTIVFDASQGTQGLKDYAGDIYAHTGVITNLSASSSDWKYVIADWSVNLPKAKLTSLGGNKFQLTISPSIREFYGVPAGETIQKLAFVFRSSDGSKQGKADGGSDIFYNAYQPGLAVKIISPYKNPYFVDPSSNFNLQVGAIDATSVNVKIDGTTVYTETSSPLSFTYPVTAVSSGTHWIKVIANKNSQTIADSIYYVVRTASNIQSLPSGAHDGINYIDNHTITLVLHAPYKNSVYTIGGFNNWQASSASIMNKTVNSNTDPELRFWITLTGLTSGQEYQFQYLVDENLKIADPYTDKVSDPWNDKYISQETYPNLIAYPDGKTEGITSVFQTAQTPYIWKTSTYSPPKKENLVIYELLVRDFTAKANYQTLIDTLGYFRKLGINAIELMPINEFEGNSSWGYNPSFYFAPDKAYGTKNKLKEFIDSCHRNGIAVIQDMVLNHSYGQSPFVQLYFDQATGKPTSQNLWYNINSNFQNPSLQYGYDFNHDSPYTRALVDSINSYWMSEYKIDGFRFDFTKGFSNTPYGSTDWGSSYDASRIYNLERMSDEIWKRKSTAFVIFEHFADNSEETVLANHGMMLWGNMNYNYYEAAMGYNDNNNSDLSGTLYTQKAWSQPNLVSYMESHDEERVMYKVITNGRATSYYDTKVKANALKRVEMDAAFFFAFPGPKMIWQFGELGYDISINQGNRVDPKPIKWDYYNDNDRLRLYQVFSALIKLKKSQDIFKSGIYSMDVTGAKKRINITGTSMNVTIIGNFDVIGTYVDPNFQQTGTWYDYFAGNSITVSDVHAGIALSPGEYHIYTTVQLDKPNIVSGFNQIDNKNEQISLMVFPNPAKELVKINFVTPENILDAEISIYDLSGKKINNLYHGKLYKGEQNFEWKLDNYQSQKVISGIYLLKISGGKLFGNKVIVVK